MIDWMLNHFLEILLLCVLVHYAPTIYKGYKKWKKKFETGETK